MNDDFLILLMKFDNNFILKKLNELIMKVRRTYGFSTPNDDSSFWPHINGEYGRDKG